MHRGDRVAVTAIVFRDGHETLGVPCATSRPARRGGSRNAGSARNDEWSGSFAVDRCGGWSYRIEAWSTGRLVPDELRRKLDAGETDLTGELAEAAAMLGREP